MALEPDLAQAVVRAAEELNAATLAAADAGLKVELATYDCQRLGQRWPVPLVRAHVFRSLA